MRYEVRCCCRPQTLLGWLEAPEGVQRWSWRLFGKISAYEIGGGEPVATQVESLTLPIDMYRSRAGYYPAVKAEGVPIETLRRAFSFEEKR